MARNQRLYLRQFIPYNALIERLNEWGQKGWQAISVIPPELFPQSTMTLEGPTWMVILQTEAPPKEELDALQEEIQRLEETGLVKSTLAAKLNGST